MTPEMVQQAQDPFDKFELFIFDGLLLLLFLIQVHQALLLLVVIGLCFRNMVAVLLAEDNSNGLLNLVNLVALVELLVHNIIDYCVNVLKLSQLALQLSFKVLISLPKFLMLSKLIATLRIANDTTN